MYYVYEIRITNTFHEILLITYYAFHVFEVFYLFQVYFRYILSKSELQTLCTKYNLDFNLKISVNWFLKTLWNVVYDSINK